MLVELNRDLGRTIVMVSHDETMAREVSDRSKKENRSAHRIAVEMADERITKLRGEKP